MFRPPRSTGLVVRLAEDSLRGITARWRRRSSLRRERSRSLSEVSDPGGRTLVLRHVGGGQARINVDSVPGRRPSSGDEPYCTVRGPRLESGGTTTIVSLAVERMDGGHPGRRQQLPRDGALDVLTEAARRLGRGCCDREECGKQSRKRRRRRMRARTEEACLPSYWFGTRSPASSPAESYTVIEGRRPLPTAMFTPDWLAPLLRIFSAPSPSALRYIDARS